jgi:hypothetical protein
LPAVQLCKQKNSVLKAYLENGGLIDTRSIVIATGAQYNKRDVENLEQFEGQGIYYAATLLEAQLCKGEDIIVVPFAEVGDFVYHCHIGEHQDGDMMGPNPDHRFSIVTLSRAVPQYF